MLQNIPVFLQNGSILYYLYIAPYTYTIKKLFVCVFVANPT